MSERGISGFDQEAFKPRNIETPEEAYLRRGLAKAKAKTIRLLSNPDAKRDILSDPYHIALFDYLHAPSEPRSVDEVRTTLEILTELDGARLSTIKDSGHTDFLTGVIVAFGGALELRADGTEPETPIANFDHIRDKLIQSVGSGLASLIELQSGVGLQDFARKYPKAEEYFTGYVVGKQWILGQRDDFGIDLKPSR